MDANSDGDAFRAIIPFNGVDVGVSACRSPGTLFQVWQRFAGFPRGWAAGILQVQAMGGVLGRQNEMYADIRNQQLAAVLYAAIHRPDMTLKILSWLAKNQLKDEVATFVARSAELGSLHMR